MPKHVRLDDPIVSVNEGSVEPVRQLTRVDIEQVRNVAQHHQPWNVMRPPVLHDGFHRSIEAAKAAGLAPVRHGKRVGLVQMVGDGPRRRPKQIPAIERLWWRFVGQRSACETRPDLVNVANVFAPNHLSYETFHAVDRCVAFQSSVDHLLGHHAVKVDQRGQAGVKQAPAFRTWRLRRFQSWEGTPRRIRAQPPRRSGWWPGSRDRRCPDDARSAS